MSGENSYLSRFFVKFVEVSAAGLATAISAYALAHFGGLLSSFRAEATATRSAGAHRPMTAARLDWLPEGSLSVLVGRHGAMIPAGRVRCNIMAIAKGYSCASRCVFF